MDIRSIVKDYLTVAQMLYLGTSHGHRPWVTTLYFAADIDLNIYWLSRRSRRHSQEVEKNSHVAGAIILPHNYGDKVRGIQFEGEARELIDQNAVAGRQIYSSKYWIVEDRVMTTKEGQDDQACYQVRPEKFVLYDEVNFPDNPSQEFKL